MLSGQALKAEKSDESLDKFMKFEALTAVNTQIMVLLDVTPHTQQVLLKS
jgi:hypothetical protein